MEWSEVQGRWTELRGKVRAKWGELTDDDVASTRGERDQLVGRLVTRCHYSQERAEQEVDRWLLELDTYDPRH